MKTVISGAAYQVMGGVPDQFSPLSSLTDDYLFIWHYNNKSIRGSYSFFLCVSARIRNLFW